MSTGPRNLVKFYYLNRLTQNLSLKTSYNDDDKKIDPLNLSILLNDVDQAINLLVKKEVYRKLRNQYTLKTLAGEAQNFQTLFFMHMPR